MDILRSAMEIEINGIELYRTAAEKAEDRQAKEMFQFLANEEAKHFDVLKEAYLEVDEGKPVNLEFPKIDKPKFGAIFSDEFKKNLKGKNYEYSVLTTGLFKRRVK